MYVFIFFRFDQFLFFWIKELLQGGAKKHLKVSSVDQFNDTRKMAPRRLLL